MILQNSIIKTSKAITLWNKVSKVLKAIGKTKGVAKPIKN